MAKRKTWIEAQEACELLGVKRATLYTYVSRGWLRRTPSGTGKRNVYSAEDIAKLCERRDARAGHTVAAAGALHFGQPVLESEISSTGDGRIAYRGVPLQQILDERWSFERVVGWLWLERSAPIPIVDPALRTAAPIGAFSIPTATDVAVAMLRQAPADAQALGPDGEIAAGPALIASIAGAPPRRGAAERDANSPMADAPHLAEWMCARFGERRPEAIEVVNAALVVCADHDLAASTFTARVTASTGASLQHCLAAALCSFSGSRHGGVCDRLAVLLGEITSADEARAWVAARRRAGDGVPGFAHQLYPGGDPRTVPLMRFAHASAGVDAPWRAVESEMQQLGFRSPRIDFGLVALCSALGWPEQAAGWLFSIARSSGWIAHVLEQRQSVEVLRPRSAGRSASSSGSGSR